MSKIVPQKQRDFAVDVVRKLRTAGFEAYWAGGCVRDRLLDRSPEDYDVATGATPDEIRSLFGHRRTLAIGAAFGVITVLGPREAGQVEVATFRLDATYSDGRHPDSVQFSSAREDAVRRDFTINGLFYDPLEDKVIDFVDGRSDIERRVIRAIEDPQRRFSEDKLRLLRAVRFAATLDFSLDGHTFKAICRMAPEITVVSPERIAVEMRRMLVGPGRVVAMRLLLETQLARAVLPEVVPADDAERRKMDDTLKILGRLEEPSFPLALAALLLNWVDVPGATAVCHRWRMSNADTDRVAWLLENHATVAGARSQQWSKVQKIVVSKGFGDLLALSDALVAIGAADPDDVSWCRGLLDRPRDELDPPPLVTGDDLIRNGIRPGPRYRELLDRVRDAQLDREISTQADALALVDRLLSS